MLQKTWLSISALDIGEVRLGAYPQERRSSTHVRVDVRLRLRGNVAQRADVLAHAVDYVQVVACLEHVARQQHCELVETLAWRLAKALLTHFSGVRAVRLRVRKPSGLSNAMPAVEVYCKR